MPIYLSTNPVKVSLKTRRVCGGRNTRSRTAIAAADPENRAGASQHAGERGDRRVSHTAPFSLPSREAETALHTACCGGAPQHVQPRRRARLAPLGRLGVTDSLFLPGG